MCPQIPANTRKVHELKEDGAAQQLVAVHGSFALKLAPPMAVSSLESIAFVPGPISTSVLRATVS